MRLVCIAGYFLNVSFNDLACNMSPGLDSVSAEHMEFAGPKLCVLMSMSSIQTSLKAQFLYQINVKRRL